ncbi:ATP-binding protein [Kitasatospora sp. NPDC001175]|uniref:ATP-binding protein n=1 Tax=Kitasatospora sp. NPDC001175 TaxID=3157103 RepID=UPI003CFC3489
MHEPEVEPLLVREIPAGLAAARTARLEARGRFDGEISPEAVDDLELVLTELVSNASKVTEDDATVLLRIRPADDALLVEVVDGCPAAPEARCPSEEDEDGRGLLLVERLCTSWGWHWSDTGKTVWATLPTAPCKVSGLDIGH